jgi:hypothetical protein
MDLGGQPSDLLTLVYTWGVGIIESLCCAASQPMRGPAAAYAHHDLINHTAAASSHSS